MNNEILNLLNSDDYTDRFIAEYFELKERYNKLHKILVKYEAGTLGFDLNCPFKVLEKQASLMGQYLKQLEIRAEIEDIDLSLK